MPIKKLVLTLVTCFVFGSAHAIPTLIDFEAVDPSQGGDALVVATADNTVTFTTSSGAQIATTGGRRPEGFIGRGGKADVTAGGDFGKRFLTDETSLGRGLDGAGDYFMTFAKGISSLSLEAADYRTDGGGRRGDIVTLSVYADAAMTDLIAEVSQRIRRGLRDGFVRKFMIGDVSRPIYAAALTHSGRDIGTGIDNISFVSVPEPGTLGLLGLGLLGLTLVKRRARRS